MKVTKAASIWLDYHRVHSKKNILRAYSLIILKFCKEFEDYKLNEIAVDHILDSLNQLTEGCKAQTKRIRFAHFCAFFNMLKNNLICDFTNPCDSPM